jgi:hypothetical protein
MDEGLRNAAMNDPLLQRLLGGIDEMDKRLSDKVDSFMDPVLNPLVESAVGQIVDALHAEATKVNQTVEGFHNNVTGTLSNLTNDAGAVPELKTSVLAMKDQLNAAVEGPKEMIEDIKKAIHDLRDAVSSAKTIMGTPAQPFAETHRHILAEICRAIGRNSKRADGIAYGVAVLGDGLMEDYLGEAEPTFRKIDAVLRDLDAKLEDLEKDLDIGRDFFLRLVDSLQTVLSAPLENSFLQKFAKDLITVSKETKTPHLTFPSAIELRNGIKSTIKQLFRDRLYETVFPSLLQGVLKDYLGQPKDRLIGALDLVFAKIEEVLLKALAPALLQNEAYTVSQIAEKAGKLKEVLKAGAISGSATLNGHSITHLRLDADLVLSVPEDFKFRGWFEFQDYGRSSPARGCIPAGALGASIGMFAEAHAELGGKGIYVKEEGFLGMTKNAQGEFFPVSINGNCLLAGAIDTGGVKLTDARLLMSLGYDPNNATVYDAYLAAKVKGKVGFLTGDVALFMGRACNLTELNIFDEDSLKILNELNGSTLPGGSAFNGVYLNWGGEVNLSEVFRIPRVLLDVSGKRYQTVFGFVRQGPNSGITAGMRLMQSMKGEVFKTASLELAGTGIAYVNVPTMGNVWSNLSNASLCLKLNGKTEVCAWEFCEDFSVNLKAEIRPSDGFGAKLELPFDIGDYEFPKEFRFECP